MLTPAYSLTSTERVLPRLALDFTTAITDPRVTTTRALNTATRFNSSGFIELVNADLPRYDFDPVTKLCLGQLIEETRINLLSYSSQIDNGVWLKTRSSIVQDAVQSPEGIQNADLLKEDTSTGTHFTSRSITVTAGTTYTLSVFLKNGGRNFAQVRYENGAGTQFYAASVNLTAGTFTNSSFGSPTGTATSVKDCGNGWWRVAITVTASDTTFNVIVFSQAVQGTNSYTGDGTSGVYPYGFQLEAGAFATSYIPTTTTSLTRNRDSVFISGTNFSSWYNQDEGTFVFEATAASGLRGGAQGLFSLNNGTTANVMNGARTNTGVLRINSTGSPAGDVSSVAAIANLSTIKAAFGYEVNNWGLSLNAATPVIDTAAVVLPVTRLGIGSLDGLFDADAMWDGQIRKIQYYPFRLSNAELQAFSANP